MYYIKTTLLFRDGSSTKYLEQVLVKSMAIDNFNVLFSPPALSFSLITFEGDEISLVTILPF